MNNTKIIIGALVILLIASVVFNPSITGEAFKLPSFLKGISSISEPYKSTTTISKPLTPDECKYLGTTYITRCNQNVRGYYNSYATGGLCNCRPDCMGKDEFECEGCCGYYTTGGDFEDMFSCSRDCLEMVINKVDPSKYPGIHALCGNACNGKQRPALDDCCGICCEQNQPKLA